MASYPGSKVHRKNRRKLGRGQTPSYPPTAVTVTSTGADTFKVVAAVPCVFDTSGAGITVATLTFVSATQVSTTELDVTMSGAISGHAYSIPGGLGVNFMGGATAAASGTF